MAKQFRVDTLIMSGKFISINPTDTTSVLRHDGTWFDTGSFADKTYVNNASGVLRTDLIATGSYLYSLIQASSAGVSSLNGRSGTMLLSGTGNVTVINSGQTLYVSGNTGAYANFVYKGETGTFVTSDKTGTFVTTAMTGTLVPTGLTGRFVNTGVTGGFVPVNSFNAAHIPGLIFGNAQGEVQYPIWGGFMSNALTNWKRRGGTINVSSGGSVFTNPVNVSTWVEPVLGTESYREFSAISRTASGFITVEMTGITLTTPSHAAWAPFLITRQLSDVSSITGIQVDFLNNSNAWETIASGLPLFTGHVWAGPYVVVTGFPLKGARFTLSISSGASTVTVCELGVTNKNYLKGTNFLANQFSNVTFSTITATGVIVSGSPIVTSSQTGIFAPTGLTGRFVTTGQTGQLVNTFYPLNSNPSSYVTASQTGILVPTGLTGIFVTSNQTGQFVNNFSNQNVSGNKSFYGFTSLVGGVQIYNGAYSDILYSVSDTLRYADMFQAQLATGGLPILDWANRYLTGNWSAQGLRISGNQVVTSAQTGDFVQTVESRPVTFTGPVTAGYINSTSGVFSYLNVGTSLTCTGPASFSTDFSVSGNGVVTSNMTGNFVTRVMTGVLVANNTSVVTTFNGGLINSGKNVLTNDPKFGVVFTTGNQTISGNKTFMGVLTVTDATITQISDGLGIIVVDNGQLWDNGPNLCLDWINRKLIGTDGVNYTLDWGNRIITGTWNFQNMNGQGLDMSDYCSFSGPVDMFDNLGVNGNITAGDVNAPTITASTRLTTPQVRKTSTALTYSGTTVVVNFPTRDNRFLDMTGDATFTGSNMADGYSVKIKLYASGAGYNLNFPTGWKFITSKPVSINPGKYAYLELDSWGTGASDVYARYTEEP